MRTSDNRKINLECVNINNIFNRFCYCPFLSVLGFKCSCAAICFPGYAILHFYVVRFTLFEFELSVNGHLYMYVSSGFCLFFQISQKSCANARAVPGILSQGPSDTWSRHPRLSSPF